MLNSKSVKVLGWVISAALVIYAVFYVNWRDVISILKTVNSWFFPLLLVIYLFDFYLRAFRWKLLLYPVRKTASLQKLFYSYNVAYFSNIFMPARTGELFRVFITGKKEQISKRTVLGTLILERILDIFGMGILIAFVVFFFKIRSFQGNTRATFLFWVAVLLGVVFCATACALLIHRFFLKKKRPGRIGKIAEFLEPVYHGFYSARQVPLLLCIIGLSIFMWVFNSFILYMYMLALSLGSKFSDSVIVLAFQLIGEFIPSAPSSIGTFHASTVIGGKFIGLTADQGLVLGILNHAYDLVIRVIFGLISIQLLNFNFRKGLQDLQRDAK